MVGTLGLSLVLVALTQLCGGQVDAWIMPAAFLLAGAGVFLLSGGSDAAAAKSIARRSWFVAGCLLVQVAVWGVALWLAGCTYDYSVDGVSYHQDAVYAFFRGCNFYLHPTECGDVTLWTRHYAKGMEMMQACVMAMTGNIESGRAVNLVLATATGLLLWHASGRLGSQLSAKTGAGGGSGGGQPGLPVPGAYLLHRLCDLFLYPRHYLRGLGAGAGRESGVVAVGAGADGVHGRGHQV